jgi:hypothetical protein
MDQCVFNKGTPVTENDPPKIKMSFEASGREAMLVILKILGIATAMAASFWLLR